jgi:hypothetical protein
MYDESFTRFSGSFSTGISKFRNTWSPIEINNFKNPHPKKVEGLKLMALRQGYAFLK